MRAVVGRPTTVTVNIADALGNPAQADDDTDVTIDVVDGAGTAVITAGVATDAVPDGEYTFVVPAQHHLDDFALTWHATVGGLAETQTDVLRVVGNRVLSPRDIANDDILSALDPIDRAVVLDGVEDLFSDVIGFPVVLEGARVNFDARRGTASEGFAFGNVQASVFTSIPGLGFGFGGERLLVPGVSLPREVFSLSINGAVVGDDILAQFKPGAGFLVWSGGRSWPSGNYDMWLSHGLPFVPGDIRDAAAIFARYKARRAIVVGAKGGLIPERTASITTEGATIVFGMVTAERPTGIPDVDGVLTRYRLESVI